MGAVGGGLTMTIGQSGDFVSAHVVPGTMEEMTTEGKSLESARRSSRWTFVSISWSA
jgi:hypothetical protein